MAKALPNKDFPKDISRDFLQKFVGQTVEDYCGHFGKKGDEHNHCAHWVSHALGFRIGKLCTVMSWEQRNNLDVARSIVVSDLFDTCAERGAWADKPPELRTCLIFAVLERGLNRRTSPWTMDNIPAKHVGIYHAGECYSYHNTKNEGVGVDDVSFFQNLYGRGTVALFGTFPT